MTPDWGYAWAALSIAVTTGVAWLVRAIVPLPDVEMLYLLAVMIAAVVLGRGPSVLAAALGVAAYDFFFVPPVMTFAVSNTHYVLTFAMMFGVGLLLSELTARLRKQEADARAAALRAKTEEMRASLLSAVSHDLRTPLAAITGAATALRDRPELPEATRAEMLETVCEEAERLERLLVNLLDMTRLESGAVQLKREWVPLEEMVSSAMARLEKRLAGRPIRIELGPELPLLSVDPVLFEQIFVNLLENAIKYTSPRSPIEITASVEAGTARIEVRDRGPGLPEGSEETVFEKFHRGVHAGVGGVGLGLPICRAIAEAHGGTLLARRREGGGTTFVLQLPLVGRPPSVSELSEALP